MANEKRLIDRNEIFPNGTFFASAKDPLKSLDKLIKRIWSIPTVDAVEVVRCKDCKKSQKWKNAFGAEGLKCYLLCADIDPDDFCSYGERKYHDV